MFKTNEYDHEMQKNNQWYREEKTDNEQKNIM